MAEGPHLLSFRRVEVTTLNCLLFVCSESDYKMMHKTNITVTFLICIMLGIDCSKKYILMLLVFILLNISLFLYLIQKKS